MRIALAILLLLVPGRWALAQAPSPFVSDLQRLPGDLTTRTNSPASLVRSNGVLYWWNATGTGTNYYFNYTTNFYTTNVVVTNVTVTNVTVTNVTVTNVVVTNTYTTNGIRYGTLTPNYATTPATLDISLSNASAWYYDVAVSNNVTLRLNPPTGSPGSAALRFNVIGNGTNTTLHIPTNWLWLQPWLLGTSDTNYTATLTNGWGWLSLVASATTNSVNGTNVAAKWYPP